MFEAFKSVTILTLLGLFIITVATKIENCSYNNAVLQCRGFAENQDKCGATR
jgi:hypothetical protein